MNPPSYRLPQMVPPPWATGFGEDDSGLYAEFQVGEVSFVLRWIPPGSFRMGEKDDYDDVTLTEGYWMGATPVTQAQWESVMRTRPSDFKGETRPVEQVSWEDCQDFIDALNGKIADLGAAFPTDAQWEYACRAGTTSDFNDGSDCTNEFGSDPALEKLGWYLKNSGSKTHPVGEKQANAWGLYDMHGNVLEWCRDGRRDYTQDRLVDPLGALDEDALRVLRGGSWGNGARFCRSAVRFAYGPGNRDRSLGFRLVAGQEPSAARPRAGGEARDGAGRRGAGQRRP